jgi:hypothetical protein
MADNQIDVITDLKLEQIKSKERLTKMVNEQADRLYKLINNETQKERNPSFQKNVEFERAKTIGMLECMDVLGLDRSKHSWIFNI